MTRHRKALIVFGTLQLAVSGVLFAQYLGRKHWGVEHHAQVTRMDILARLDAQGLRLPTPSERPGTDAPGAIVEPVRVVLDSAESQAFFPITALAAFGAVILVLGLKPERPRERILAEDERPRVDLPDF